MKLGVVFPQIEFGNDPIAIRDYTQTAEDLGYDYFLVYDHVLGANPDRPGWDERWPYTYKNPFHEPFVLFGFLAGLTKTIEFVTGILILPQRQTALVAKQAAEVDVLSGGRLRLGMGIGWNEVEYEALGKNFRNRGKRIEEQVSLLRQLWTNELVDYEGRYETIPDAGLNPLPVQRPIPIWFGGMADVVLRRMARLGDGWFPSYAPGDKLQAQLDRLHSYLLEAGRQPEDFGIDGHFSIAASSQPEWVNELEAWRQLGATHVGVNTMGAGLDTPQAHIEAIRRFKEIVG